jgi:hypothetical protein
MRYLVNLERFFESNIFQLDEFDRFVLYSCLGFITTPKDDTDSSLYQFRPQGSENQKAINTIQSVLNDKVITEGEIEKLNPIIDHILYLYDNQGDASKSLQLKVYLDSCKKKFGYESSIKPDISDNNKYPKRDSSNGPFDLFRGKKSMYKKGLYKKMSEKK